MSPNTTRRWPRLSNLIFAVGYASASLTLTNFADIPDSVKLKACKTAYNTPLEDCTVDDFSDDNTCSKKCRASISDVEDVIIEDCASVTVSDTNSLLYRALKGQLVEVICGSSSDDDDDDTPTTTTAQAVTSNSNKNQVIATSIITRKSTSEVATTSEPAQTTSLVLAGDDPTDSLVATVSTSSAEATETSSGSGRGGDPFANNTSAGANIKIGYATLVISALVCMVVVI